MKYAIVVNGAHRSVEFTPPSKKGSRLAITVDERHVESDAVRVSHGIYSILIGGRSFDVTAEENAHGLLLRTSGHEFQVKLFDPRSWRSERGGSVQIEGRQQLLAPMPGKIVRVLASEGQHVEIGQGLLVIEAMKMQNEVRSPKSGNVEKMAREGQTVDAGEILAIVS